MNESVVKVSMQDENELNCSYAIISKDSTSIVIILKKKECGIFDYDVIKRKDFRYEYLLLKHYDSESVSYKDFLKLIGKMCTKDKNSKYFGNHKQEDNRMVADSMGARMINEDEKSAYDERYNDYKKCVVENIAYL